MKDVSKSVNKLEKEGWEVKTNYELEYGISLNSLIVGIIAGSVAIIFGLIIAKNYFTPRGGFGIILFFTPIILFIFFIFLVTGIKRYKNQGTIKFDIFAEDKSIHLREIFLINHDGKLDGKNIKKYRNILSKLFDVTGAELRAFCIIADDVGEEAKKTVVNVRKSFQSSKMYAAGGVWWYCIDSSKNKIYGSEPLVPFARKLYKTLKKCFLE